MKENKMEKSINSLDLIFMAFGAMIGWGWVVASGAWIHNAGVLGTVLGFSLGGLMIFFVGLIYAELTTAMPKTGGEMIFSYRAFGPKISYACTWAIILSYVGVICFEACSLPTILQYVFPNFLKGYLYTIAGFKVYASWLIVGALFAISITLINVLGVKVAARFQNILTTIIGLAGILLVVVSSLNGDVTNLKPQLFVGADTENVIKNILSIAIIAPFFLFGFDVIPQAAEEINVPLKKLGKVLVLSVCLAVVFYALVVLAIGYALNINEINHSLDSTGLVAADAMAKMLNSHAMAKIVIIAGLCGIISTWNSFLLGASRAIYSLSVNYMLPPFLGILNSKYKTPQYALLFIGVLSVTSLFFGRVMLTWVSNVASFACCICYFMVSLAFVILRIYDAKLHRPYKVKYAKFIAVFASILTGGMILLFLIPGTNCSFKIEEFVILGLWLVFGVLFGIYSQKKYRDKRLNSNTKLETIAHNVKLLKK